MPARKWEGGTGKEESVLWKSWNLCFHHMALILALLKALADFWRTIGQHLLKVTESFFKCHFFIFHRVICSVASHAVPNGSVRQTCYLLSFPCPGIVDNRVSQKNKKSEFCFATKPTGFHRLDEPPEKNSAL